MVTTQGEILQVINGGSIYLLVVNVGRRIVEQAIEPRYMQDIVEGEGLVEPGELVGRQVELAEDGMSLSFA